MEQQSLLGASCSDGKESERGAQESEHITCMDSGDPSFGQNEPPTVLPVTAETDDPLTSQDLPETLTDTQALCAEQFHLLDPNGQPLQYDLHSQMTGMAQVTIPREPLVDATSPQDASEEKPTDRSLPTVRADTLEASASNCILRSQASLVLPRKSGTRLLEESLPSPLQPLSSNTPIWACRLRSCEKIGDSYRGYCVSETELESILTFHKQQTQSVWGTRQSPSPAKSATRLMWKSQYVPYDGIPFVNAGSRAVVMECQYGPRRKGFQLQRLSEQGSRSCHLYRATCPARIYIKKVQKFPEYRVPTDPQMDRKMIRVEQEKAFSMLKKNLVDAGGVLRWYVQLPTQQAHQYHELETRGLSLSPSPFPMSSLEEEETVVRDENCALPSRLHPQVAHKIQELVSQGIGQVYAVRKQLRKFVERELFKPDELQWTTDSGNILRETVTVTFAEGNSLGEPVPSRVGASRTQTSLSPGPFHLLSPLPSFQPKISSHLQGLKLQPRLSSLDGSQSLVSGNGHPSSGPSGLLDAAGSAVVNNHSLLLGQSQNLRTDTCLTQNSSAASAVGNLPESVQNPEMGPLVEAEDVEDTGNLEGSVNRILLGDVQTIPVQVVGSHSALIEESLEDTLSVNQVKQEPKESTLSIGAKPFLDCKKLSAT
ncbi:calcium-responsive transcription factor isoform X3 [Alexandromys fortis]|uniref:calcium-responsive transcription factor isoform X3 n=1 Tax=Alexandromys fortis TaxID=100897 RepID=UPI0021522BA1|nr:calcium-responsive transcription factor isoform X3 [Microtus fortis]